MRAFAYAAAFVLISAPAGAVTAHFSGSVFASNFTEIVLPDFFPAYAPHNGAYNFKMILSRPADSASIITDSHTIFIYDEWNPGGHILNANDWWAEDVITTVNNADVIQGSFTGASYRAESGKGAWSYWLLRQRTSARPVYAELWFLTAGPLDYTATISGPVPEPANWALLVAGFGLVGASLRRQRAGARKFARP